MPLVRFVSPTDPKWLSTLRAVERRLVDDSLVRRYELSAMEKHPACAHPINFTWRSRTVCDSHHTGISA